MDAQITEAEPGTDEVRQLIGRHMRFTRAATPAEFAFVLDPTNSSGPA